MLCFQVINHPPETTKGSQPLTQPQYTARTAHESILVTKEDVVFLQRKDFIFLFILLRFNGVAALDLVVLILGR
jgi:hypothetical protein